MMDIICTMVMGGSGSNVAFFGVLRRCKEKITLGKK
jgi:hypothetical protein